METITEAVLQSEIYHRDYNLSEKDNLDDLPAGGAVFGIFAIIDHQPKNCRYVGYSANLRETIKDLFQRPHGPGLKRFMQGPWIKMLLYLPSTAPAEEALEDTLRTWTATYRPAVDEDGEYPGYYV